MGMLDAVLVAISHNISFVGKTWWLLMVGLRLIVVLLAGFTLFSDEQERFVCNTIQPGCSNVCFNLLAPVSLFRLWLLHIVLLSLPYLMFATHIAHRLLWDPNSGAGYVAINRHGSQGSPCSTPEISQFLLLHHHHLPGQDPSQCVRPVPSFHYAYLLVVTVHILMEAAFVAGHVLFFGFFIPRSFLCYEAPCTSGVQCYVSRPTEKTLMLDLMLGLACLSVVLSLVDLVAGARRALRRRRRATSVSEEMGKGEQSSVSSNVSGAGDLNLLLNKRMANGFESDIQATPRSSTDSVPNVAAALKGEAEGKAGKLTDEKGLPWQHSANGKIGFSTNPKAMPLPFVVHNQQKPPELASLDGSLAPRLENFTPADTRKQGQLASMESTSTSRQNSTPSEGPDKRAWV
ncbi:gap junction delta-4 protein-like [Gadus morhua]|uniref:gap junction delta-4 protein-like n=1 Tax=Gadus morhua TaxID=8049 RepID=UPI0011B3BA5E|nr:gap junction delta-4 protein-like [Gadus morhua]